MTEIEEELTETLYRRDNKIKKYKQALEEISILAKIIVMLAMNLKQKLLKIKMIVFIVIMVL